MSPGYPRGGRTSLISGQSRIEVEQRPADLAYRRAQAGVLAPVDYLALPYTALSGFVFFAEVPTVAVWAGAALIVPACLIVTGLRK
jgi:hypothetical protein